MTEASARIPHSFRRATSRSFGHLISTGSPLTLLSDSASATPATSVRADTPERVAPAPPATPGMSGRGRHTIDTYKPAPGGECHARPMRPRPRCCMAATTVVPSSAPEAAARYATSLVEGTASKYSRRAANGPILGRTRSIASAMSPGAGVGAGTSGWVPCTSRAPLLSVARVPSGGTLPGQLLECRLEFPPLRRQDFSPRPGLLHHLLRRSRHERLAGELALDGSELPVDVRQLLPQLLDFRAGVAVRHPDVHPHAAEDPRHGVGAAGRGPRALEHVEAGERRDRCGLLVEDPLLLAGGAFDHRADLRRPLDVSLGPRRADRRDDTLQELELPGSAFVLPVGVLPGKRREGDRGAVGGPPRKLLPDLLGHERDDRVQRSQR